MGGHDDAGDDDAGYALHEGVVEPRKVEHVFDAAPEQRKEWNQAEFEIDKFLDPRHLGVHRAAHQLIVDNLQKM